MKYEVLEAGVWFWPKKRGFKLGCCDCGLVHKTDYRIKNGHVEFRVFRDNRATGQIRRHKDKLK